MPANFPPNSVYPTAYDSNYTLIAVHDTVESVITSDNPPWAEEVDIKPVPSDKPEIWGDNGFATISGELFYYDSVEQNAYGKVNKLKGCIRNIAGEPTQYNVRGTDIRSYVIAEHHNNIVETIINIERLLGAVPCGEENTLTCCLDEIEIPVCEEDNGCPDVSFDFTLGNTDDCQGTLMDYTVNINGSYNSFRLDFGDGSYTTIASDGQKLYAPGSNIDPSVTVGNSACDITITGIERTQSETVEPSVPQSDLIINIPDINIPNISYTPIEIPAPDISIPPLNQPCIDLEPINISIAPISIGDINIPSVITVLDSLPTTISVIADIPTIISVLVDMPTTISVIADIPTIISVIDDIPTEISVIADIPTIISVIDDIPSQIIVIDDMPSQIIVIDDIPSQIIVIDDIPSIISVMDDIPATIIVTDDIPATIVVTDDIPNTIFVTDTIPNEITLVGDIPATISVLADIPVIISVIDSIPEEITVIDTIPSVITVIDDIPSTITVIDDIPEEITVTDNIPATISIIESIPRVISVIDNIPEEITLVGTVPSQITITGFPSSIPIDAAGQKIGLDVSGISIPIVVPPGTSLSCTVTIACPSNCNSTAMMPALLDDGSDTPVQLANLEVDYEFAGLPSKILIEPPTIKPIRLDARKVPKKIKLDATEVPSEIKLITPDKFPSEIQVVVPTNLPSIKIDYAGVPEKIAIDWGNIPDKIRIEAPDLPSVISIEHNIPSVISIEGMVKTISVEGIPDFIPLRIENPQDLVFKIEPTEVKITLDTSKLITADESGQHCFALVPCKV